jgi:hypothetical protein
MSSIDKHSLELNVLDYQTDNLGVLTQLWDEIRVISSVERDGHFRPLHVLGVAGPTDRALISAAHLEWNGQRCFTMP